MLSFKPYYHFVFIIILTIIGPSLSLAQTCQKVFDLKSKNQTSLVSVSTEYLLSEIGSFIHSDKSYFPKDRFVSRGQWTANVFNLMIKATDSQIETIITHYPELLPKKELISSVDHQDFYSILWGFALRDYDFMKKRILFFVNRSSDYQIPVEVRNYLQISRDLPEQKLIEIYGPLLKNYFNLSKEDGFIQIDFIQRKRAADAVISTITKKMWEYHQTNTLSQYQKYINKVNEFIERNRSPEALENVRVLNRLFKAIQKKFTNEIKSLGVNDFKLIIVGSFVNGQAKLTSDIDYGLFVVTKENKELVYFGDANQVLYDTLEPYLGGTFEYSNLSTTFPSSAGLTRFGLQLNSVVIEITSQNIQIITENQNRSLSGSPLLENATLRSELK